MTTETEELDMSIYTIPLDTSVVALKASSAFQLLGPREQKYAYYIGKASWEGAKICLLQCSPESVPIFCLFQLCFGSGISVEKMKARATVILMDQDIKDALMYVASFYGNMGNYKSFGDTKFVPQIESSKFKAFLSGGIRSEDQKTKFETYWTACSDRMYSLEPRQRQLGLGKEHGVTTYFSANCEEADSQLSTQFLNSQGLSPYNTRLFKTADKTYVVKVASSDKKKSDPIEMDGNTFQLEYGDYSPLMKRIADNLKLASDNAADATQKSMLLEYCKSFTQGSIHAHKEGSRYWIRDVGPTVESYIGFIESYRDPAGLRGEWEGFVACVNKEVSMKFQTLVDKAPDFLELMPWSAEFEKATFQRPDFTSLEVLAFGSSGVPAGINIPNYDDIRQNEGFKNVSLGNVLQASYGAGDKPVTFILERDQALFKAFKGPAFEVQVGIHELLGHGSGRLYHKNSKDSVAFLESKVKCPWDASKVLDGPFYDEGTTWDSTFGKIASPYEECRAECSGIYLCLEKDVLQVFGHSDVVKGQVHDIIYINWLLMVRAGLMGLEFFTPETKTWRQAHMNARYVILRVLLEAAQGLVKLELINNDTDVLVHLERDLIPTVGKKAIGDFLEKLQVYKSMGDFENASQMFGSYSEVSEDMLKLRAIVMARKEPRKLLVQPHMSMTENSCQITEYAESPEGMIESFVARFPAVDEELWGLYEADLDVMKDQ